MQRLPLRPLILSCCVLTLAVQISLSQTPQGAGQLPSTNQNQQSGPNQNGVPGSGKNAAKIPAGAVVYVAQMQGGLDGFISAELVKQKIPVRLTTDESTAEYVLTGTSIKEDDKWYHVVFGGKDKNEGNVTLIHVKEKRIVWAGEAGDRSLWWGGWKRGGERKVADRIVSRMKKDLF